VNQATIDKAANRSLMMKFAKGLFDRPVVSPENLTAINSQAHQDLALRAAEEGVVLLKNAANILPFGPSVKKIAVIGPNAGCSDNGGGGDSDANGDGGAKPAPCGAVSNMLGSYTQYSPTAGVTVKTVKQALEEAFADTSVSVKFEQGAQIGP
jgi:beta-glucosidase